MGALCKRFNVIIPSLFFLAGTFGILLITLTMAVPEEASAAPETTPITVESEQDQASTASDLVIM